MGQADAAVAGLGGRLVGTGGRVAEWGSQAVPVGEALPEGVRKVGLLAVWTAVGGEPMEAVEEA